MGKRSSKKKSRKTNNPGLKEKVEFLEEVKNNLRALSLHFASVEEHQNLAVHTNTYMLDDQSFLIDSTTFLTQCNRMTRTGLYL